MTDGRLDSSSMKLLVVEDDAPIAEVLCRGLSAAGYSVELAADGSKGLAMALHTTYAAVVLDWMLPGLSGLDLCRQLRQEGNSVPILMLTAKDSVTDRVGGLETGADDYLVKPFEFPELVARIRALLRRDKVNRGKVVQIGHLTLDLEGRVVRVEGEIVNLKPREYELLEALALNEGRVLTRDAIQTRIWDNDESYSNIVDVQVRRLRLKIERPGYDRLIHTVHSLGYTMRRPIARS